MVIDTKITEVLGRMSDGVRNDALEQEFQSLLKEKKRLENR